MPWRGAVAEVSPEARWAALPAQPMSCAVGPDRLSGARCSGSALLRQKPAGPPLPMPLPGAGAPIWLRHPPLSLHHSFTVLF